MIDHLHSIKLQLEHPREFPMKLGFDFVRDGEEFMGAARVGIGVSTTGLGLVQEARLLGEGDTMSNSIFARFGRTVLGLYIGD